MILKQSIKTLIDLYGIEKINDTLGEIFDEKMKAFIEKSDAKQAKYFDELSEYYDEINRNLANRPFRDDMRETT